MTNDKIIRSICCFSANPTPDSSNKVEELASLLTTKGFLIQTKRICSRDVTKILSLEKKMADKGYLFATGSLVNDYIDNNLNTLLSSNMNFNLDLTNRDITTQVVNLLAKIIKINPKKTFEFAYVFNNAKSSPYFPSADYEKDGFSIGLQPTNMAYGCDTVEKWLRKMKSVWMEIYEMFNDRPDFLGIDSSVCPLYTGHSSLVAFIKKLSSSFPESSTTDIYAQITNFIKTENPKPAGLCGLMLPCLEDFELAQEYEKGEFSLERNIFLSLQSGLGIDTYPIGIDEAPERVMEILKLLQILSNKYKKPLSARFVSDGKAKIGEKTDFQNQYLRDVIVRKL